MTKPFTDTFIATQVAIKVAQNIIDKVGLPKELKGNYKKAYDKYCEKVNADIKFCKKEYKDYQTLVEELEMEKTYINCFLNFIRDEMNYKLVKKHTQKEDNVRD